MAKKKSKGYRLNWQPIKAAGDINPVKIVYYINENVLDKVRAENNHYNWVMEAGVKQIKDGKKPGKLMVQFLTELNILC